MTPILDGAPGFILLTLSVGLAAYIRQVYVATQEVYDKVSSGGLKEFWPLEKQYTQDRLKNLLYVQNRLRAVTFVMFLFICASAVRILFYAIGSLAAAHVSGGFPARVVHRASEWAISDAWLRIWDFGLISYLTVAFFIMWWTHWRSSSNEHQYHVEMRADLQTRSQPS